MFFAAFLALCPPPADDRPPVALAEAERFQVPAYAVRGLRDLSMTQDPAVAALIVSPWNNHADDVERYKAERQWRFRCWDLLDDVVGCPTFTPDQKRASLTRLRDLIGDEAFYAGRMPDPLCDVRVPAWRPR